MKQLVLLRHGESEWNKLNLFTGWTDVDLTQKGEQEAAQAGKVLLQEGLFFPCAYTSYLKRAIKTLQIVLDQMDLDWIPIYKDWHLNEKHYGTLQGLNKSETVAKYGEEQVHIWRRSYDVAPEALDPQDPRSPLLDRRYAHINPAELPLTESLKDTTERTIPFWKTVLKPALLRDGTLLVVAHGNSLRSIVKHIKGISDEAITQLNLPTGVPYLFVFDDELNLQEDRFLGDPEEIKKLQEAVANQGKQ